MSAAWLDFAAACTVLRELQRLQPVKRDKTACLQRLCWLAFQEEAGLNLRIKLAQRIGIFSLGGCHLQELPPRLQKLVAPNALANVEVLNVSGNQLQQLPQWLLSAVPRLVVANLSMNSLCLLPEGWKLPDLAVIDLSFNKLEMLPSSIGSSLPSLRSLFAPSNFLTANGLPASLAAATQLQELFLTDNVLGSVPLVLGRCTALVKLSLAACQLSRLGDELASLTALRCVRELQQS
jgi:Leucine-rich repeat (LRR) protein